MADYNAALIRTLKHEGGYINHPSDPGGETYCGISRRANPVWEGWGRIDEYKKSPIFPNVLESDSALRGWMSDHYRKKYWKPVAGDSVRSQDIANELFDTSVHLGPKRAVRFLQIALNAMNRKETIYPNIKVDGDLGPATLSTIQQYQEWEASAFLLKLLVIQRGAFYIKAVQNREESEAFIRGWLRRVKVR